MFGSNWHFGWVLIAAICVLVSGCQQTPYRDIVRYTEPDCDQIVDDGFDETCIVYQVQQVFVPVEVFVEVPGPVRVEVVKEIVERIVKVPVTEVKIVERIVRVPVDRIVEVPVEVIREVERIVEVPGPVQIQIQKVNSFTGKIKIPPEYKGCQTTCHAVVKDNKFVSFDLDFDQDGVVDKSVKAFKH